MATSSMADFSVSRFGLPNSSASSAEEDPIISDPWDVVRISGTAMPGVATVSGPGLKMQTDALKTPNKDGASVKLLGRELTKFTITLTMWTNKQWKSLWNLVPILLSADQNIAFDVVHPAINLLRVHSVVFEKIGVPKQVAPGKFQIDFECFDFRQLKMFKGSKPVSKTDLTKTILVDDNGNPIRTVKVESPSNANVRLPDEYVPARLLRK